MSQPETTEEHIGGALRRRAACLATAESCSGGLIAHRITNAPGASDYFAGGVVAYSNEVKEKLLGVAHKTLVAHGAVSQAVAREMAMGARAAFGVEYAVACTGIAGPGGGTTEKPVGLVYIAVAAGDGAVAKRHLFDGDRERVKEQTAQAALNQLREALA